MANFLTSNELNSELEKLFDSAEEQIVLISPFIKLHERFISVLRTKLHKPKLKIVIVFGKNDSDFSKSMKLDDFIFFKDFPNIEIRYEKRLHAKYYANEFSAILTSMNLYSFSQDNNIEAGILMKSSILSGLTTLLYEDTLDVHTANYFNRVMEQSDLLFKKTPEYDNSMLGLSKKYKSSKIEADALSDFFSGRQKPIKESVISEKKHAQERHFSEVPQYGFCIRTGKQIPFNLKLPMGKDAFESWSKFKNKSYAEKYCHFSGEESHGNTSYAHPVLSKYWDKVKNF